MTLITRLRGVATFCTGLFWSLAARADLPKIAGGTNSSDVMEDVKIMSRNGVSYGALVICAAAFIVVVISCVGTYHKIGEGKATWFDFGLRVVVGAIMIVVAIYFLNKAVTVI
ncbi:TIGR03745 family integrating conjugative element membrane protein [Salmonella enterica subsp. enterica serovar Oranienburg]|nr:TIGR03745 family integrating conjugative element membrane protein [Salmonella enterica subsp. enterica serovar Oranienburg]